MYCVKCGVGLPSEAQSCAKCGGVVDELLIAPLSDELKTEVTTGDTTQSRMPQTKPSGSLLQAKTRQVIFGVLATLLMMGSAYGLSGSVVTVVAADFDHDAWAARVVRGYVPPPDVPTSNWNAGWRAGVAGLQKSAGRIGQAFLGLDLKGVVADRKLTH